MNRNKPYSRYILWGSVVLGLVITVYGMAKLAGNSTPNQAALLINTISPSDWTKGGEGAKVTLVEYSDFQCPACGAYYPMLKKLREEFGDKIAFAYRHFPLYQIHANAGVAARAAEAAGKQGKFWEMHDVIFETQEFWSFEHDAKEIFIRYAGSLGLNEEQFKKDIDSDEVKAEVQSDLESGIRSRVNSTPTFFLNGEKIQNPRSYDEFKKLIESVLATNS